MTATMSQSNQVNSATDNAAASYSSKQSASQDVGLIFVREYYTFLNKNPHRLHAFYSDDSLMIRGEESEEGVPTYVGREAIRRKIEAMDYDDCRVLVTQVDSQRSAGNGILVQVLGEMCNRNGPVQKFSQAFFLAPQPNGYYVLNDILRFLKDEISTDDDLGDEEEEQQQVETEEVKETLSKAVEVPSPVANDVAQVDSTTAAVITTTTTAATEEKATVQEATSVSSQEPKPETEPTETKQTSKAQEDVKPKHRSKPPKPEGPKTWAVLAAGNEAASKNTPNQSGPASTDGKTSPNLASGHGQTKPHAQTQRRSPAQPQSNKEHVRKEDATEIFIKNVVKTITTEQLKEVFSAQFGAVENVTIVYPKNCAFLQFASPESCQKALAQNKVTVGDTVVLAEERRPQGYKRQQQNGNFERRFPPNGHRRGGGAPRGGGKPRGGGPAKQ